MQYIYKRLGIKIKTISPYNLGFLKTERHIRTGSEMIAKQLNGTGQMWIHYLQTCTFAYNIFTYPPLDGLGPFQLLFGRPLIISIEIETIP